MLIVDARYAQSNAHRTHLSVVKGRKPIVRKNSSMNTFSLIPTRPVAAEGLRRALLYVPKVT